MPLLITAKLAGKIIGALTGAALAVVPPSAAAAQTWPRPADTALTLTITHPEPNVSSTRSVILSCDPPRGYHRHAAEACDQLDRWGGEFAHGSGEAICTADYRPVIAEATGRWRGRPVDFKETFSNDCVLRSRTGIVFDF